MRYKIKVFVFVLIWGMIASSCSQSFHCRKCLQGATVTRDTITVRDTIVTTRKHVDTLFSTKSINVHDTIVKRDGKAIVRYVKLPGDTVWVDAECESDTLYIEKKIPVTTKIEVSTGWPLWKVILICVGELILAFVLFKMFLP